MIYARSVRPVVQLLGAFAGVGLGVLARGIDAGATALLDRSCRRPFHPSGG